MADENDSINSERAIQIKRLLDNFESEFLRKTSSPDSFASLHDIEQMWGRLRADTDKIYSDAVHEMFSQIDEGELIRKKKRI